MTYYLRSGESYSISSKAALNLTEILPAGNYAVKYNEMKDFYYVQIVEDFTPPKKIYGDTLRHASRIINTFLDRDNSTGVMLTGEQGSGKTLLAKMLAIKGVELNIPTLLVNEAFYGETFNQFLQSIEQPIIVLFDEFEKVYDKDDQERMLTLLDGVYPSKKLFILTCNDKYRINSHMKNRPGRIFYRLDYTGLDQDFIREYCEDNLDDKSHTDGVCRIALLFSEFNFDMLKGLIEDMNRYEESPQDALKMLNAKPENSDDASYEVALEIDGELLSAEKLYEAKWFGNPLSAKISVMYKGLNKKALAKGRGSETLNDDSAEYEDEGWNWKHAKFNVGDIKNVDSTTGKFHFENVQGQKLGLLRVRHQNFDWAAF